MESLLFSKILRETEYNYEKVSALNIYEILQKASEEIDPNGIVIEQCEILSEYFKSKRIHFQYNPTSENPIWKYGDVSINQSWYDSRNIIHILIGEDFFEQFKYPEELKSLAKILKHIYKRDTGKIPPFKVGYESVSNID
jgi:hypothetical protein